MSGIQLRRECAVAKIIGIPLEKGWRKKLVSVVLTEAQQDQVNRIVAGRNGESRARRLQSIAGRALQDCPYELHPEFEISGELYFSLRNAGFDARLEVSVPSNQHRSGFMRVDIGLFEGKRLTTAIECKREGKKLGANTRQASAYRELNERFGVAIHFVNYRQQIGELIRLLQTKTPEVLCPQAS